MVRIVFGAFTHISLLLKIPHVIRDIITFDFVPNTTHPVGVNSQTHEIASLLDV